MAGLWKALALATGILAAKYSRQGLESGWERVVGNEPPKNPASHETTWPEALAYATLSGAVIGIARMVAQRGAAEAWHKAMGDYPPGLEDVS